MTRTTQVLGTLLLTVLTARSAIAQVPTPPAAKPATLTKPAAGAPAGPFTVASPNGSLAVTVDTVGQVRWAVALGGRQILRPSRIGMVLDGGRQLGQAPRVLGSSVRSEDRILTPVVRIKRAEIRDRYNERRIDFAGDYA
ncbi:MAG: glycoside hydrolase family 97 N-terminal domain-containing protein, partial [Acidobacteria bacterium]|nr:glycoside hydrolase family 97 N-terminal domain-containing protein [Acidobacteriota bacterium]